MTTMMRTSTIPSWTTSLMTATARRTYPRTFATSLAMISVAIAEWTTMIAGWSPALRRCSGRSSSARSWVSYWPQKALE